MARGAEESSTRYGQPECTDADFSTARDDRYLKAFSPVTACPSMSECTSCVPSYV